MTKQEFEKLLLLAQKGDVNAMYLVALEYELGEVVDEDIDEAVAWMNEAADRGHSEALDWLKDYYFDDDANVQSYS